MSQALTQILDYLAAADWGSFHRYTQWIGWNLFLAYIPLVLSVGLFRWHSPPKINLLWGLGCLVFLAFLPNAPYVLTDIIHLLAGIREGISGWFLVLIFLPVNILAILIGFQAYVISLINLGYCLGKLGYRRWLPYVELGLHGLAAIGVYLGRFIRFNSWDLITSPRNIFATTLNLLTRREPLVVILFGFFILTILYWVMKQVTLGLILRWHYRKTVD
ncbi:putative membrane protein [Synechococcus sp. PCC 6312]|nr:putative membrane protein [Synechococcus sp. PCC 6312]